MEAWFAAMVLSVLMCFTTQCYFFQMPDDLRGGNGDGSRPGRWGKPDAEFNWCEPDYALVDWIAEPVNTVSCACLFLPPLFLLAAQRSTAVAGDVVALALLQVAIGVGSVFFHASLRYNMQLADELPMLWWSLVCVTALCWRLKASLRVGRPLAAYGVGLTALIVATSQQSFLHQAARGLMSVGFATCLVVIGWGSARMVSVLHSEIPEKRRRVAVFAERMHTGGFVSFVLSIICWLADNHFCPLLRQLPFGLPYPHMHTMWHILVSVTLYLLLGQLHIYDRRSSEVLDVKMSCLCLPVVSS